MGCSEVKDLIQLYMDSELDPRSTLELQRHLEDCVLCSRALEAFTRQDKCLREAARAEFVNTTVLRTRVLEALQSQTTYPFEKRMLLNRWMLPNRRMLPRVWKQAVAATAVAAAVILVFLLTQRPPGAYPTAYAAVVSDHSDHCSVDPKSGAVTDAKELSNLLIEHSGVSSVPDLSDFGYSGRRARICKLGGVKFVHLIFFDKDQRSVSLFLGPHISPWTDSQARAVESPRYKVTTVGRPNLDVIVVTSHDEDRAVQLAQAVASLS